MASRSESAVNHLVIKSQQFGVTDMTESVVAGPKGRIGSKMMDVSLTYRELDQGPAPIRALRSLRPQQADRVARAVMAWPAAWTVERHDDYDGYFSILVSADHGKRTFLISGLVDDIELFDVAQENLLSLGRFASIEALIGRLAMETGSSRPGVIGRA
jgi:hypothetical protein